MLLFVTILRNYLDVIKANQFETMFFFLELGMLSGVAAILRFPMPDLEAEEYSDDSSDSDD